METLVRSSDSAVHRKSTVPRSLPSVQSLAARWMLPGLIVMIVVANQLSWTFGPLLGYVLGWVNNVVAVIIVISVFRRSLWPFALIAFILLAKSSQLASDSEIWRLIYLFFLNTLFCAAGAVVASRYSHVVYKQILAICVLNMVFMTMQVTGIGAWTQFLTSAVGEEVSPEPSAVFFVPIEDIAVAHIQRRPSGLLHANQFLSFVLLFALALHFSRKHRKVAWGTLVLCIMAVLAMSKIVFLGFIIIVLLLLIGGNHYQRSGILRATLLMVLFLGLYAVIFPGLFTINLSIDTFYYSFFTRINNIVGALDSQSVLRARLEQYLADTPYVYWDVKSFISGYTAVIRIFPYVIASLPVLTLLYLRGFRKLRSKFPHFTSVPLVTLFAVIITFPGVSLFFKSPLYWFIAGFAFLPLFIVIQPRYFKGALVRSSATICAKV